MFCLSLSASAPISRHWHRASWASRGISGAGGEVARIRHLSLRTALKIAALDMFLFQQQLDANSANNAKNAKAAVKGGKK